MLYFCKVSDKGMDAKTFITEFGRKEARRVAEAAGTSYVYFSQLAYGHRRPSVYLAERLVAASDGRMSFEALLKAKRSSTTPGEVE